MPSYTPYQATDPAEDLVNAFMSSAAGIGAVSDVMFVGADGQTSFFADGSPAIGLESGILLTSGDGSPPNMNTDTGFGIGHNLPGDPDLDTIVNTVFSTTTNDANVLEFTFEVIDPNVTTINFNIVFGSEEFPEYVDDFVDIAGLFVNGTNYALFNNNPDTPLSVLQQNLDEGNFIDNTGGGVDTEYDGISQVLQIVAPVTSGQNTVKIAVADTGDDILDSGIFIGAATTSTSTGGGGGIALPPVALDDTAGTEEDNPVLIDVIANDTDADGVVVDANVITGPGNGSIADNDDGTFSYTPDAGFSGIDTFTYVAVDDDGGTSNPALVTIDVEAAPPPPPGEDDCGLGAMVEGILFSDNVYSKMLESFIDNRFTDVEPGDFASLSDQQVTKIIAPVTQTLFGVKPTVDHLLGIKEALCDDRPASETLLGIVDVIGVKGLNALIFADNPVSNTIETGLESLFGMDLKPGHVAGAIGSIANGGPLADVVDNFGDGLLDLFDLPCNCEDDVLLV